MNRRLSITRKANKWVTPLSWQFGLDVRSRRAGERGILIMMAMRTLEILGWDACPEAIELQMRSFGWALSEVEVSLRNLEVCGFVVRDHRTWRLTEEVDDLVFGVSGEPVQKKDRVLPEARRKMSYKLRFSILERDGFQCRYCGGQDQLVVDHVLPVSRGGTSTEDNLVAACQECNSGKGQRVLKVGVR